jgi:phosphoglycolate phosphatase
VVRPVRAVIFDLDGTLVQTRYSSWEVFREVSQQFDLGFTAPEQYYELFRSNVYAELEKRFTDAEQFRQVKEVFLERLRRDYHPVMIPGMLNVVRRLASVSTLALLSSNALPVMRRILVDNDLAFCFAHAFGGDTVPDKRTAIRQFLADTGSGFGRRCSADYDEEMIPVEVAAGGTVLVTDTAGDVREAIDEGIRAVGVAWGMHSVDQLMQAGAEFVALWPQEVGSYLMQGIDAVPRGACEIPTRPAGAPPAQKDCPCGGACTGAGSCSGACGVSGRGCEGTCPVARRPGPLRRSDRRLRAVAELLSTGPSTAPQLAAAAPVRRTDATQSPLSGPTPPPAAPATDVPRAPARRPTSGLDELSAALRRTCR